MFRLKLDVTVSFLKNTRTVPSAGCGEAKTKRDEYIKNLQASSKSMYKNNFRVGQFFYE